MSALQNVIQLQFPVNEVKEVYDSFLSIHSRNSNRTVGEYRSRVEEFFKLVLGKDINHVTLEDIQSIKKKDVQTKFIDVLKERRNTNSTIKTKLNSIRSFYNEMLSNDLQVNPMIFRVKLNDDVVHHESLTYDELQELFEFMKNEKELAMEKYLLVKMMFTTANRKTATIGTKAESGLTWEESFAVVRDADSGEEINVVRVVDKGEKLSEKPISKEFYEELQEINKGQKYVFNFNPKTLTRSLNRFSKQIGRKITPHSLKATAITIGYQMTKDINLCKQLGGHSSLVTTEIYLHKEKSLVNQLSYNMSKRVNPNAINELSHEELLEFIEDNEDIKRAMLLRLG
jgi:site-specific recombinase XerC